MPRFWNFALDGAALSTANHVGHAFRDGTILSLFMFFGFDDSGLSTVNKIVIATACFSVASLYLLFLKRFEAAVVRKNYAAK